MEGSAGSIEHESMREVMLDVLENFPQLKALMTTPEGGTSTGNSMGGGERKPIGRVVLSFCTYISK